MLGMTEEIASGSDSKQKLCKKTKSQSVSQAKTILGSEGSILTITCTMSVTLSKVRPMKNLPSGSDDSGTTLPIEMVTDDNESLVKSRQRVADHGEVFTPSWLVDEMLNLVKNESERIDSRFLESACGAGNFLKTVLERKLESVQVKYGKSEFETRHYALLALMSIYGIELLEDNIKECRAELLAIYSKFLGIDQENSWYKAAIKVLIVNIIQGDALTLTTTAGKPMRFPEWGYLGSGKYQRRDFQFDDLTQRGAIKGTLFEMFEEEQLFVPVATFPIMSVEELAK